MLQHAANKEEVTLGNKQLVLHCRALCSLERLSAYHSRAVDSLQSHVIAALPRRAPEPPPLEFLQLCKDGVNHEAYRSRTFAS